MAVAASAPKGRSKIEERYLARTPLSREMQARAEKSMPGGETRSVFFPPYPVTLSHGKGVHCYDLDSNEYMDLSNNYTVLIHGHCFPPIVEAVKKQVELGTNWSAKAVPQVELAEMLCERFKIVDKVRFANSGTEAVLAAVAIARAYTGKRKILISRFSYHGHLLEPSSSHGELRDPNDRSGSWLECYLADFGDAADFERVLAAHDDIAAVMLEPVLGQGGCVTAPPEFWTRVKAAAHKAGALLVLDEATVHRVSTGGAQKYLGIEPDLTVMGKLVGGGLPCGSVGGTDEVMKCLDPRTGNCHLSGTFTGNPLSMSAGVQAVKYFTDEVVTKIERDMSRIQDAVTKAAAKYGLPFSSRRVGNIMQMYFSATCPPFTQVRTDQTLVDKFQLACTVNGLFVVTRIMINSSSVATDDDITEIIQRLDRSLEDVAADV
jgi:glutamate-1-semialdehyde 2,1-aminomutase